MITTNFGVKVDSSNAISRLKELSQKITMVGKATEDTARSFKNFNRTVFGATAFVGIFTQAFQGLADTLMKGSELDRTMTQFSYRFGKELPASMQTFNDGAEAVVGPNGRFIQMIRGMTSNSIDMMAAMRSAIQLRSAGVTGDVKTMAEIVARAGTAAKMAGKDSAEGIRRVTDFLKDGSLAHLQHLGLLREVNPELKAQLAILNKAGGVLGTAVTASYKLALGMKILREHTKGQLKGQRDLRDTLQDTAQFFHHLKSAVGTFIGKALQPLLEGFIDFSINASFLLEDIKNNKKEILFLAKGFIIASSAVAGFVLVLGGLRLAVTALTSLVGGIPFMTAALLALGAAAIYTNMSTKKLIDNLQTIGQIAKGAFQLIKSFISSPENFAAGIGMIDESLHDLLKKKGLLTLVTNISRVGSIITVFLQSTAKGFVDGLNGMLDKLGSFGQKIKDFLGIDSGNWKRNWLVAAKEIGTAIGKLSAQALAFWGVMKLFKTGKAVKDSLGGSLVGGMLSKTKTAAGSVVGGLGSLYSKGTKAGRNAILAGAFHSKKFASMADVYTPARNAVLGGAFHSKKFAAVADVLARVASFGRPVVNILSSLAKFTFIGAVIGTTVTALTGFVQGLIETSGEISRFVKAVTNWVSDLFETNPILKKIKSGFTWLFEGIISVFKKVQQIAKSLGIKVGKYLGEKAQMMHNESYRKRFNSALDLQESGQATAIDMGALSSGNMTMPEMPENQTQAIANIIATMKTVSGDKMDSMAKALEKALSSDSASGLNITSEEWVEIFASGMDKSKKVGEMANANKNVDDKTKSEAIKSGRSGVC